MDDVYRFCNLLFSCTNECLCSKRINTFIIKNPVFRPEN